jgi:hypothetical protein
MAERMFPVQVYRTRDGKPAQVRESLYLRAYEVYCHLYGEQQAMVDHERGCRGGFSSGELLAFLYARTFPKAEWRDRVEEAFAGMNV